MANRHYSPLNDAPEPCQDLAQRIMLCIEEYERRVLRVKIAIFGVIFTGSFSLALAEFVNFGGQLSHSGFLSFASLLFSDFSTAITNLPDLFSSMAESFPIIPAALVLGGVAFAMWSAGKLIGEVQHSRKALLLHHS